jgi:glycogen synthase
LIDHFRAKGIAIDVVHTHDYGNTMQHVQSKGIASVNTFHSEPGRGLLPYYLEDKLGEDVTQRGNGMVTHHVMYTVSPEYEQWLTSRRNPNSQYSIPMHSRGRVTHVTSIPNKNAHGFHTIVPYLGGYCSEEHFLQMSVGEKKKLAKQILADKIMALDKGYHFDPDKRTLLFIGRVSKQKGSEFLEDIIKAAETLNCNVVICGYLQQQDHEFSGDLIERLKREYPWVPFFIGKDEQSYIGNLHRASSDIGVSMSFN